MPLSAPTQPLPVTEASRPVSADRIVRVGILGCGSVSQHYMRHLRTCPHARVVSLCDAVPGRAGALASEWGVTRHYSDLEAMLDGEPFDLFVNLAGMQRHESLNLRAIEAGKHIWSEKPIANTLQAGREMLDLARSKDVRIWGAPTVVESPQFAFMARALAQGELGRLTAAQATYGHLGPDWAAFFYTREGGSLPDLGVYNLTFLTGLLGPARSVAAMTSIVTPHRHIQGTGEIEVTEEDNAMVLLEHEDGVLSHVACGFNYFNSEDHAYTGQDHHTITVSGRTGVMKLAGYDWGPHAVDISTVDRPAYTRCADAPHDYVWECGASMAAECLATGREPMFTPEHALHVVEIMAAARESQATGRHVRLSSTFRLPLIA